MVETADRVALQISPKGTVQVTRQGESGREVVVEFEFGQLEAVIHWLRKAISAWAAAGRDEPERSPWFGGDPRSFTVPWAGRSPSTPRDAGGTGAVVGAHGAADVRHLAGVGATVPMEALMVLSRLPRHRPRPAFSLTPEEEDGGSRTGGPLGVDGFAGFAWETRISQIPELAWTDPTGETREGIPFHVTHARLVNEAGYACYYFDPLSADLIGGAYVFSPAREHWDSVWDAVTQSIQAGYPALSLRERVRPTEGDERRKVGYVDPQERELVGLSLDSDTGIPLLHILYRSRRLMACQAQAADEDRRKLGPVGNEGDGSLPLRLLRS